METTANSEQRAGWNGESGDSWVRLQAQFDGALAPWAELLAEASGVVRGERVLDIGCGNGATTRDAAVQAGPSGLAVGVDLSEQMLARARELAAEQGVDNARFVDGDAQVDDLAADPGPYDAAISRFGVMFFDDPVAAFANIGRAVKPGGRLVFVAWAEMARQQWLMVPAAAALQHLAPTNFGGPGPGMFALADTAVVTDTLQEAGWKDVSIATHERRILIAGGGSVDTAVDHIAQTGQGRALLAEASPEAAELAIDAMREALREHVTPAGVELSGVAHLVTARR